MAEACPRRKLAALCQAVVLLVSVLAVVVPASGVAAAAGNTAPTCSSVTYTGDGTSSNPYEVSNADQLQCIGENHGDASSLSDALGSDYELVSDIDGTGTENWNGGKGFDPIGDGGTKFTGTIDGDGHSISDLTIDRGSTSEIGLFGVVGSGGTVRNVTVDSADVTGDATVGALVGKNEGTVERATAVSGSVTSDSSFTSDAGGLIGENTGTVQRSYATASVSGSAGVGGLVGRNTGTVDETYAAGSVSGGESTGGLVGQNSGTVQNSYWDADTTGQSSSAGSPDSRGLSTSEMQGADAATNMGDFQFESVWRTRASDYPTFNFRVADAPTVDTNAGLTVDEGSTADQITNTDLAASDAEGDPLTYTVTDAVDHGTLFVDGSSGGTDDGSRDGESALGTGTFTQADIDNGDLLYSHDGSDTTSDSFGFDVSDGNGGSVTGNTFSISITPVDDSSSGPRPCETDTSSPTAIASASPEEADPGEPVDFNAGSSRDDCGIESYEWDFDDDGTYDATGQFPTHSFATGDTKTVTLRVTDEAGNTDTGTVTVDVEAQRPPGWTVSAVDTSVTDETPIEVTVSADQGGRPLLAVLRNGTGDAVARIAEDLDSDGTSTLTFDTAANSAINADDGPYTVTVTDNETGFTNTTDDITVSEAATGTVSLNKTIYSEERGDIAAIGLSLSNTDTATVTIGEVDDSFYATNVTVRDGNGDRFVTLRFNTFTAGTGVREQVVSVATPADAVVDWGGENGSRAGVDDPHDDLLVGGDYGIDAVAGATPAGRTDDGADAVATLSLGERSTDRVTTFVAPGARWGAIQSVDDIERLRASGNVTQTRAVATGDLVLARIDATGLAGVLQYRVAQGSPDQTAAFFAEQRSARRAWELRIDRLAVGANDYSATLGPNNTRLIVNAADDDYWLVVDTRAVPEFSAGDRLVTNFTASSALDLGAATPADVTDDWGLVNAEAVVDTNADVDGDGSADEVTVERAAGQEITGTATVAPGTRLSVRVSGTDPGAPFVEPLSTVVQPDGTWRVTADFSQNTPGANFSVDVQRDGVSLLDAPVDGRIAEPSATDEQEETTDGDGETDDDTENVVETDVETDGCCTTTTAGVVDTVIDTIAETTTTSGAGFTITFALVVLGGMAALSARRDLED